MRGRWQIPRRFGEQNQERPPILVQRLARLAQASGLDYVTVWTGSGNGECQRRAKQGMIFDCQDVCSQFFAPGFPPHSETLARSLGLLQAASGGAQGPGSTFG